MNLAAGSILSFFIGAIPTAYLFGKYLKGIDIREFGSGNVGATNAGRVLGRKIGVFVYFVDFLKGFLPVMIFSSLLSFPASDFRAMTLIGFSSVLGHIFTPFLKFKGGKGIATGGGVLACSQPIIFLSALLSWTIYYKVTKIVSLSSLLAVTTLTLVSLYLGIPREIHYSLVIAAILVYWSHRSNISRLWSGTGV